MNLTSTTHAWARAIIVCVWRKFSSLKSLKSCLRIHVFPFLCGFSPFSIELFLSSCLHHAVNCLLPHSSFCCSLLLFINSSRCPQTEVPLLLIQPPHLTLCGPTLKLPFLIFISSAASFVSYYFSVFTSPLFFSCLTPAHLSRLKHKQHLFLQCHLVSTETHERHLPLPRYCGFTAE